MRKLAERKLRQPRNPRSGNKGGRRSGSALTWAFFGRLVNENLTVNANC